MKYLKEFLIIMSITAIGEMLRYFLPLPIPASIYGLVLMFTLLTAGIVRIDQVKMTAHFLIEIMPVMFIPAAVGLIVYWSDLRPILFQALVLVLGSTIIVMGVTGKVADFLINREGNDTYE